MYAIEDIAYFARCHTLNLCALFTNSKFYLRHLFLTYAQSEIPSRQSPICASQPLVGLKHGTLANRGNKISGRENKKSGVNFLSNKKTPVRPHAQVFPYTPFIL